MRPADGCAPEQHLSTTFGSSLAQRSLKAQLVCKTAVLLSGSSEGARSIYRPGGARAKKGRRFQGRMSALKERATEMGGKNNGILNYSS
ncbi:hypothetical protein JTE90_023829 [Oedothorax gibbosus]|uniref:Uncharacterized protein n=1 Tax=Oedothorax gibbosus TaxID=931172 RepID=A0AAV6VHV9_9ARAC|nr:hypothetical protein JTE90_023829 [Oedothorax gibbosus]